MTQLRKVLAAVQDDRVDSLVFSCASEIDTVAQYVNIDPHYLSVQVRLHLPQFSDEELFSSESINPIRIVLRRLRDSLEHFAPIQLENRVANHIDDIPPQSIVKDKLGKLNIYTPSEDVIDLNFIEVNPNKGLSIQQNMHYIHSPRKDTRYHFGLAISGLQDPIAYASFSTLDRQYLYSALLNSKIADDVGIEKIAVMTRAFGYNPLPKNSLSKLFDRSCRRLAAEGYKYVITALNPFLGFQGSVFSGSSFVSFSTSPMRYWYNEDGHYMNRRSIENPIAQRYETPPILWLVRALDSRRQRLVESYSNELYSIGSEAYDHK